MTDGATAPAGTAWRAQGSDRPWGTLAFVGVVGLATAAAAARAGTPVLGAVPVLLVGLLWVVATVPLRWSTSALLLLVLSLDISSDAMGKWRSPLAPLGNLLQLNLDKAIPGSGLKLSGLETLTLVLYAVAMWRRAVGDEKDTRGQEQTAGVVRGASLLYLSGLAYATVVGLSSGGVLKFAIVQVRPLLTIPALYLLFHLSYRGRQDHATLARLVLVAACVKTVLAVYVDKTVAPYAMMRKWEYSTNHGDSLLFDMAILVLVTHVLERPDRKRLLRALVLVPFIGWGVYHNHRRLAYVGLAMAALAIFAISPWSGWKRKVTFVTVVGAPMLALYLMIGWANPGSALFAPVKILRTVSDAKIDRSTLYREVENYNLVRSIAEAPVVGRGFGHPFTEYIKGDSIASIFELYAYEPHDAILGLLLFGGLYGFTALWSLLVVGIFLAVRAHRRAVVPEDRAAALCAMSAFVLAAVQIYGDMGQYSIQLPIITGMALMVAGKLAVRTGAWPHRRVRQPPAPGPDHAWLARLKARLAIAGGGATGPVALALPGGPAAGRPLGRIATPLRPARHEED